MSDFIAALWREFEVETQEHLEAIEPVLLTAETGVVVTAEQVASLFRAFHSIKGLARSMDLSGMESVAHAAESLLSLVRDGTTPLDADLVAVLLPALDTLKAGRRHALTERRDQPAPQPVLAALKQAFERLGCGAPLPTPDQDRETGEAPPEPEPLENVSPREAARENPEMLSIFGDLLRAELPVFTRILSADFAQTKVFADTLDAIERIEHAADTMGYYALVDHMRALAAIVESAEGRRLYPDARKALLRLLGQIGELQKEICGPAGPEGDDDLISDLKGVLGRAFEDELHETYCNIIQALSLFSCEIEGPTSPYDNDEELAEEVAGLARLLYSFVLFLDWPRAADVMLVVEDVFSRVAGREVFLSGETTALTRSALTTVFGTVVDRTRVPEQRADITPEVASQFTAEFRKSLRNTLNPARASLAPVKVGQRFLATLEIKPALIEMLSPENIAHIMDLVQVGYLHLYEVLANPEKSPELTQAFLAWTESQVKPITNRSVFIAGETWFEFLMASMDPPEAVIARAAEIDPAGSFIQVSPCQLKTEAAPVPVAPAAAAHARRAAPPSPPPSVGAESAVEADTSGRGEPMLRVRGEAIDSLLNQIGEMISLNGALSLTMQESLVGSALQSLRRGLHQLSQDGDRPEAEALIGVVDVLHQYVDRIRQIEGNYAASLSRLQEGVLELRVVPVDTVFGRFPRVVRDLAQHMGKQVRLEIDGGSVRIDKGMVEALADPLMHMVRNAIDHGVESPEQRRRAGKAAAATITLSASRKGNRVMIEVRDDGAWLDIATVRRIAVERGLIKAAEAARLTDREMCRFIFQPGFSTAAAVTETSGRGVGMDVVWTNVSRVGGTIDVDSETGKGTCFILSLPLSAAIQSALIVAADGNIMAIPDRYLAETCHVTAAEVQTVRGQSAMILRDQFLPVFPLTCLLGHPPAAGAPTRFPVVVIENGRQRIGLIVDRLYRRQDLFVKDIHPQLAAIPGVGGASTLGDGRVILILDGDDLFRLAEASVQIDADGVGLH